MLCLIDSARKMYYSRFFFSFLVRVHVSISARDVALTSGVSRSARRFCDVLYWKEFFGEAR